jgi:hypothetical protein
MHLRVDANMTTKRTARANSHLLNKVFHVIYSKCKSSEYNVQLDLHVCLSNNTLFCARLPATSKTYSENF